MLEITTETIQSKVSEKKIVIEYVAIEKDNIEKVFDWLKTDADVDRESITNLTLTDGNHLELEYTQNVFNEETQKGEIAKDIGECNLVEGDVVATVNGGIYVVVPGTWNDFINDVETEEI